MRYKIYQLTTCLSLLSCHLHSLSTPQKGKVGHKASSMMILPQNATDLELKLRERREERCYLSTKLWVTRALEEQEKEWKTPSLHWS